MNTLATRYQLRVYLGLRDDETGDDARLLSALVSATSMIERVANRRFSPRRATLAHSINLNEASELLLDDDLLELVTLVNGDGTTIPAGDILTLPGNGDRPDSVIRLVGGAGFVYDETPLNAVEVTGVWGWHDRWSAAWRDSSDTVQDNPLAAAAATLTVMDADGADAAGETPRFQVGQLLRIEDEYLWVLAVDATANTLTVERGVNGTTASSHAAGTSIDVYQPPQDATMLCLRWAAWLYREPDGPVAQHIPPSLLDSLAGLRRVGVKV